jgi:hypothetical protein
MDMQNVSSLVIPEGGVKTIHDKNNRLLWGSVGYDTKYAGNTTQNGEPTPDAPVTVNVVTGVQSVWVHGKNMIPFTDQNVTIGTLNAYSRNGSLYLNGTVSGASVGSNSTVWKNNFKITLPAGTYALSGDTSRARTIRKESDGSVVLSLSIGTSSGTFTLTEETKVYFGLYISSGASFSNYKFDVQLELSSATAYEPYQGATYTVDLGSTEFCKIGTYQDYIYKSGADWYVHKETCKVVLDGSSDEDWSITNSGTVNYFYRYHYLSGMKTPADGSLSNILIRTGINSSNTNQGFDYVASGELRIRYGAQKTTTEWKSFLSTTPMLLYYPLDNSTDIQITDATLISQLDAIHEWLTRYGYDATVSGNLPLIVNRTNL